MDKKILVMLSFLVFILCIGAVSAVDASSEPIMTENSGDTLLGVSENTGGADTVGASSEENNVLGDGSSTFTNLNNTINGNNDTTVYLSGNYAFVDGADDDFKNGIVIKRNIVIDGQGQTVIDGSNLARAFYVAEGVDSVILKNIKIQNTYAEKGAVIYVYNAMDDIASKNMSNLIISGEFINNTATDMGGVLYALPYVENIAFDGTYTGNKASYAGGVAGFYNGVSGDVTFDGTYTGNKASYGGVVCSPGGVSGNITFDGIFTNNYASLGAVAYFTGDVSGDVTFRGNYTRNKATLLSSSNGGGVATFRNTVSGNVTFDGTFTSNSAYEGGVAIFIGAVDNDANIVFNGTYTGNNASSLGGVAMFRSTVSGNVTFDGIFTDNYGVANGGVVYFYNPVSGDVTFDGTYSNNSANNFGGVAFFYNPVRGDVTFDGTYSNNSANNGGVAGFYSAVRGDVTFDGTYSNNSANNGGVAMFRSTVSGDVTFDGTYKNNVAYEYADIGYFGNDAVSGDVDISASIEVSPYTCGSLFVMQINKDNATGLVNYVKIQSELYADYPSSSYRKLNVKVDLPYHSSYENVIVKVNISDNTYDIPLNSTGQGNITIDISSGVYNITIYYEGDENYTRAIKTGTVNVIGDAKTFTDLYNDINSKPSYFIKLDGNYVYNPEIDSNFVNGISISRNIIIDGQGAIIDGADLAKLFDVSSGVSEFKLVNVTVQNTNGVATFNGDVSDVLFNGTFTGNSPINPAVNTYGIVALFNAAVSGNVVFDGTFTSNSASGGCVAYFMNTVNNGASVTFDGIYADNTASIGGVVGFAGAMAGDVTFRGNYARNKASSSSSGYYGGGVVAFRNIVSGNVTFDGTFTNNIATKYGGVSLFAGAVNNGANIVFNGTYTGNSAVNGGVSFFAGAVNNGANIVFNGTYTDNKASSNGGVVYFTGAVSGDVTFDGAYTDNKATASGGVSLFAGAVNNGANIVFNGTYTDNSADNGGVSFFAGAVNNGANIVFNGTYTDNKATFRGGVSYFAGAVNNGANIIFNGTYSNNNATDGGVAYFNNAVTGDVTFDGTYSNNNATYASVAYFNNKNMNKVNVSGIYSNNIAEYGVIATWNKSNINLLTSDLSESDIYEFTTPTPTPTPTSITINPSDSNLFANLPFDITIDIPALRSVTDSQVTLKVGSTTRTINLTNGKAVVDFCYDTGMYTFTVNYDGNETYASSTKSLTVNVRSVPVYSFTDLNRTINGNDNTTVKLNGIYVYNSVIDSAFVKGINISRNIIIDGQNFAVIDGNSLAKVFNINSGVAEFKLVNVTVQNTKGVATFNGDVSDVLFNGTYTRNSAATYGIVALFNAAVSGNVVFDGTFTSNSASGGAVAYFMNAVNNGASVTFDGIYADNTASIGGVVGFAGAMAGDVTFRGNYARNKASSSSSGNYGGGVVAFRNIVSGNVTFDGTFTNNIATKYGGVSLFAGAVNNGANIVFNGTYTGNSAANGGVSFFAGAVNNGANIVFNGTYTNNKATSHGGVAYFNAVSGDVTFDGTYTNNAASSNGGVSLFAGAVNNGANIVFNGTYTDNSAYQGGVSLFSAAVSGNVTFDGTFTDNSATNGGVAFFNNVVNNVACVVFNGTFTDNSATNGGVAYFNRAVNGNVIVSGTLFNNSAKTNSLINFATNSNSGSFTIDGAKLENNTYSNPDSFAITLNNVGKFNVTNSDLINTPIYVIFNDYYIMDNDWNFTSPVTPIPDVSDINKFDIDRNPGWKMLNVTSIDIITPTGVFAGDDTNITITINVPGESKVIVNVTGVYENVEFNTTNGTFIVPLYNIAQGTYDVSVIFNGNDDYRKSTATSTFTVDVRTYSFADLSDLITGKNNTVIDLSHDYTWKSGDSVVLIDGDNLIINGNGFIIDALGKSGIFNITGNNVTINNLTLINAYNQFDNGAAVVWSGDNGTVNNTNFIDNIAASNTAMGAGIYATGDDLTVDNCYFEGNIANHGAGIAVDGNNANIIASTFVENTAVSSAPIYINGNGTTIRDSEFRKNSVGEGENTIVVNGNDTSLINCNFIDNDAGYDLLIANDAVVSLSNNTVSNYIFLESGSIVSDTTVTVLENSTVYGGTDEAVLITAVVADDKGNIIVIPVFKFALNDGTQIDAIFDNVTGNYNASYLFDVTGVYTVGVVDSVISGLSDCTVFKGTVIIKNPLPINVAVENIEYGQNATIVINLGEATEGNVTITITGDNNYTAEYTVILDGSKDRVEYNVDGLNASDYNVVVTFNGNDKWATSSNSTDFTVDKIGSSVSLDDIEVIIGNNVTVTTVNITDGSVITIVINGKTYTGTVKDNSASVLIDEVTSTGTFDAVVSFAGDNNINPSNSTSSIKLISPDSFTALQKLIDESNDTVVLDRNYTFDPNTDSPDGVVIDKPIDIDANGYTLDANGSSPVFNITSDDVSIEDATFTGANGTVVDVNGDNVSISDSTFVDNTVSDGQALIDASGTNGTSIVGNDFVDNVFDNATAIDVSGSNNAIVENNTFADNDVSDSTLIDASGSSDADIKGTEISGNDMDGSTGIDVSDSTNSTVEDTVISGNDMDGSTGIDASGSTNSTVEDTVISGNNITDSTGIDASGSSDVVINNTEISGNEMDGTTGIDVSDSSNPTVENTVIENNVPVSDSTLIDASNSTDADINNTKISGNNITNSTGIDASGSTGADINNTEISGNDMDDTTGIDVSDSTDPDVDGTKISGNDMTGGTCIDASGSSGAVINNTEISGNNITDSILIDDSNSSDIVINGTDIHDNNITYSTVVNAPDVIKYYHGPERFVVEVSDSSGSPKKGMAVVITINGVSYNRVTDDSGVTSIPLNLNSGVYNVTVVADNVTVNSVVTILTTVNGTDVVKVYRNGTQYYATFRDSNGNYLANGTAVEFNVNGVKYTRTIEGNEGLAKLNINLPQGSYIITAYNPVSGELGSNNILVVPVIVENNDLVKYYKNDSQFVVKVIDATGKAAAGVTVTFNVNGVFYYRTTDADGHAKLNINLPAGDYVITSEYAGCRVANNIKVLPVLSASDMVKKQGSPDQFVATLVDGQGRPYANQVVSFNINGVLYNRITDSEGHAKLNINLPAGEYIITSSFNGSNIANKITVTP